MYDEGRNAATDKLLFVNSTDFSLSTTFCESKQDTPLR